MTAPIFLPSRCGLADAISHKQIFDKPDAAAMLRGNGAVPLGGTASLHIVVRAEELRVRHQQA
ncbi:hypothetical protein [Bradyrhizobium sp.]|uniref:hypothetical protein n=1 Tax=Bradyrhizobium sp. TaxID=376 RepID=UPI0040384AC7